jgi:hypothetical protein
MGVREPIYTKARPWVRGVTILALVFGASGGERAWAEAACRHVIVEAPGSRVVSGAEDLAVDRDRGVLYLSAFDRRAVAARRLEPSGRLILGGIYAVPVAALAEARRVTARDVSAEFKRQHDFRPHGIGLYREGGTARALFAVNRSYRQVGGDWKRSDRVEMFDLDSHGLRHRKTVAHPLMCRANDVAALGPGSFLVTNDHGTCAGFGKLAEDVAGLSASYVLHYDGKVTRKVATNIPFANGIVVGAGGQVYVAATRGHGIHVYDLKTLLAATKPLSSVPSVIPVGSGVDNLSFDNDGALLAAVHPSMFKLAVHLRGWLGPLEAESHVARIPLDKPMRARPSVIFKDNGIKFPAATSAVAVGSLTVIGSVTAPGIMVCKATGGRAGTR